MAATQNLQRRDRFWPWNRIGIHMLKDVYFIACSMEHYFLVREFLTKHTSTLAEWGYLYPCNLRHAVMPYSFDQGLLLGIANKKDTRSLAWNFAELEKQAAQMQPAAHTLLLNVPILYSYPESLQCLCDTATKTLQRARKSFFYTISRQDLNLESFFMAFCLSYPKPDIQDLWSGHQNMMHYDASLGVVLDKFGKDSVTVPLSQNGVMSNEKILGELCKTIGLNAQQADLLKTSSFDPVLGKIPHRDVLAFMQASNFAHTDAIFPGTVQRWSPYMEPFLPNSPSPGASQSFLGPAFRSEIVAYYQESNTNVARMLSAAKLFPDIVPEENWVPFTGLQPDASLTIAQRLDRNFAKELLADFDEFPTEYQTMDQRVCHQALREAITPAQAPARKFTDQRTKVAVLTTTYGNEAYIEDCIHSVLMQKTDFPIEHIIADDCSSDKTQQILQAYAQRYSHITLIFQPVRSGGSKNVHDLFSMAKSPYVALCEGDDYFTDPHKLQTQVNFLDANPDCALCFHPVRVTYEDDPTRERFYPPVEELPRGICPFYYLSDLIKCNLIQTNSVMYRWRFANGLPKWFRPGLMPGDWYWHLLHAEKGKIGFINRVMSVYRRHKTSVYYLAEVDRLKHRYTVGLKELEAFDVVNEHFNRKFESILLDLTNGVFADCLLYAEKTDDMSIIEELVKKYPHFGQHFLNSLKIVSGKRP